jgi:hypothetical protein
MLFVSSNLKNTAINVGVLDNPVGTCISGGGNLKWNK